METTHLFIISGIAVIGLAYLVWRRRTSKRDVYIVLGKIGTTFVFGVVGLFLAIGVAIKISSPSASEYAGVELFALFILAVPIGVIGGTMFGMTLFKIISKLLSRKKNEKK